MYRLRNLPFDNRDVQRLSDKAFIPFDPANTDYQSYLKWLEEGNVPLPADEPPADEPPADEPPVDEPPVDEPPADEPPADEPPADEPPADEPPADEPPADEPPVDEVVE